MKDSRGKDLYIIGAGGFGRETVWLVEQINEVTPEWKICGFIDDNTELHGSKQDGYTVLGGCDYLLSQKKDYWVVCAVGSAKTRKKIIDKISFFPQIHFATVIDPDARISERAFIGEGSIICAGNIITVDVRIGRHAIINLSCTVGHDAVLEDFVTLYPGANISGNVTVGEATEIGTGTKVIQGKKICSDTIIGAGAVVVKDIGESGTYVGVPAERKTRTDSSGMCVSSEIGFDAGDSAEY